MHVSAWPSIYTGTTPGRHGLYHAYQVRAGDQRVQRTLPEWCARPPFWKFLDDAGRRCIVFDAFMDFRLPDFKGVQILEYGTWTWFSEPWSSPRGLYQEIVRRFGPYPAPEHSRQVTIPDQLWFREKLLEAARVKSRGDALAAGRASLGPGVRHVRRAARRRPLPLAFRGSALPAAAAGQRRAARRIRCATSTRRSTRRSARSWPRSTTGPRS